MKDYNNFERDDFSVHFKGKYSARRDIARNGRGKKPKGKDHGLRKFRPHNHHSQDTQNTQDSQDNFINSP